jgi:hypothetical protein
MNPVTAESRPNGMVAICGLLADPDVLAALLESRALVDAAADGDADAFVELADALRHTWVSVPARDLAGVAEVVGEIESRTLVIA